MAAVTRTSEVLLRGDLEIKGRMPWSSNGTYLASVQLDGEEVVAVYKPRRGERPLWDFPDGLCKREVAAYELSEALGWGLVPLTVLRSEGPLGEGSLQQFVPADFEQHYFTLYEDEAHHDRLRRICAFDLLANNTDRKSGHCLLGEDGRIYAIDNGLSFHAEFKLRTVIWEFGGQPVPAPILQDVACLVDEGLTPPLVALLDPVERDAVLTRARALLRDGCFPVDHSGRRYPWPLV
ncbi:MAG TPA: SCO1664 family protein [Acidimicrobiales bacterium]|nr:SCO1664 family protein [Acidimicrobiales bacterium]